VTRASIARAQVDRRRVIVLEDDLHQDAVHGGGPRSREERAGVLEGEHAGLDPDSALEQGGAELDRAVLDQVERHHLARRRRRPRSRHRREHIDGEVIARRLPVNAAGSRRSADYASGGMFWLTWKRFSRS